jgi:hypothetical protein
MIGFDDGACGQEEQSLEQGVVDDVVEPAVEGGLGAQMEPHDDQAHLADGMVGENQFDILLADGQQRSQRRP